MKYCIDCKHSLKVEREYVCMRPVPNDKVDILITGEQTKPLRLYCKGERGSSYHCGMAALYWEANDFDIDFEHRWLVLNSEITLQDLYNQTTKQVPYNAPLKAGPAGIELNPPWSIINQELLVL